MYAGKSLNKSFSWIWPTGAGVAAWAPGGGVFSLGVRVAWELRVAVGWRGGKGHLAPVLWLKSGGLGKTTCV